MTFSNAYHGVKKIFTAELLEIIGTVCLVLSAILGLILGISIMQDSAGGAAASSIGVIVLLAASGVLPIIALIMNLVGLHQAAKDEDNFRTAFWICLLGLVVTVVSAVLTTLNVGNGIADNFANTVSQICAILTIVFTISGITVLADKLNNDAMTSLAGKVMIIIIIIYALSAIAHLIPVFFGNSATIATIDSILGLVGGILSIVGTIVYLVFLGQAKTMLRDN